VTEVGERYRLLRKIGNDWNADGTPGAPLTEGMEGVVKQRTRRSVVLDFSVGETVRSVSFPPKDLTTLFERVEEE
jgi:hypothetical protein